MRNRRKTLWIGIAVGLAVGLGILYAVTPHHIAFFRQFLPGYILLRLQGKDCYDADLRLLRHGNPHLPEVALTFDDGPRPGVTEAILDILKRYRVPATFFVVGVRVKQAPDLLRRVVQEGHEIGSHTHTHLRLPTLTERQILNELRNNEIVVARAVPGLKIRLLRPPGGEFDRRTLQVARRLGYVTVLWSATAGDYENVPPSRIRSRIWDATDRGAIILLHESNRSTVAALPQLIEMLRAEGLRFVTVSQMLNHLQTPNQRLKH